MKSLRGIVRSEFFPAAAVLAGVVLFWTAGLLGGLSLLSRSRPILDTVSWLYAVYAAVVLSPLAALWAAGDLIRRLLRRTDEGPDRNQGQHPG